MLEQPPISGEFKVLVTFIELDDSVVVIRKDQYSELTKAFALKKLTDRELEILRLAERGLKTKEIATELGLTDGNVRNHLSSIFGKLGVENRMGAIFKARELGILE